MNLLVACYFFLNRMFILFCNACGNVSSWTISVTLLSRMLEWRFTMYCFQKTLRLVQRISLSSRTSQVLSCNALTFKHPTRTVSKYVETQRFASTSQVTKQQAAAVKAEPFLNGSNAIYVEAMYESWLEDPASVHKVCARCCISIYWFASRIQHLVASYKLFLNCKIWSWTCTCT